MRVTNKDGDIQFGEQRHVDGHTDASHTVAQERRLRRASAVDQAMATLMETARTTGVPPRSWRATVLLRRIVEVPPYPPRSLHPGRRLPEKTCQHRVALVLPPELLIRQQPIGLRRPHTLKLQRDRRNTMNVRLPRGPTNQESRCEILCFQRLGSRPQTTNRTRGHHHTSHRSACRNRPDLIDQRPPRCSTNADAQGRGSVRH